MGKFAMNTWQLNATDDADRPFRLVIVDEIDVALGTVTADNSMAVEMTAAQARELMDTIRYALGAHNLDLAERLYTTFQTAWGTVKVPNSAA